MDAPSLAAVVAAPHDPAPRHEYAAAVRATDPTRADFIERQLAIRDKSRRGEVVTYEERKAVRDLRKRYGLMWAGPIAHLVDRLEFWGGFVEDVTLDAARLIAHHAELSKLAPIRHLSIGALAGREAEVARLPILGQLASLDVGGSGIGDVAVAALVASPHLAQLRSLRLTSNRNVTIDSMRAIGAANLPSLMFVEATGTDAPLVVVSEDWGGSITDVAWTRVRTALVAELGHRPWLDEQVEPSLDSL